MVDQSNYVTAKATQLKHHLNGYSSFWTGEYYEENNPQTYQGDDG